MPVPDGLVTLVGAFHDFWQVQQTAAKNGSQVLQRYGGSQLEGFGAILLGGAKQLGDEGFLGMQGNAGLGHEVVVFFVLTAVHGFLPDKGGNCLFQLRVGNLVTIVTDAVDKEAFTHREKQAHGIEELADIQAVPVPGQCLGRIQVEFQVAADG